MKIRFSLWAMLVAVSLIALALGCVQTLGLDLAAGFWGLGVAAVFVLLLALAMTPITRRLARLPYWASLLTVPLLYGGLNSLFFVLGEAIDQPHPFDICGRVDDAMVFMPWAMAVMAVLVLVDSTVQSARPRDPVYYPQVGNLWHGRGLLRVRLILIVGGLLVVWYYAPTVIEVWASSQRRCGLIWPPKRVLAACHLLWGVLWLADCASRPKAGTIAAAIGYLCAAYLLIPSEGVLRE